MRVMSSLTDEQKKKIEENRQKALALRAAKLKESSKVGTNKLMNNVPSMFYGKSESSFPSYSKPKPTTVTSYEASRSQYTVTNNQSAKPNYKPLNLPSTFGKPSTLSGSCRLLSREKFTVDVGYDIGVIDVFKKIPSRCYDAQQRKWTFSVDDHDRLMTSLSSLGHVAIAALPKRVVKILKECENKKPRDIDLSDLDAVISGRLLPFQKEGVCCAISRNGRILIADDMGLGKTIQALAVANYYLRNWPLLIVAPSSVRYFWFSALCQWLPSVDRWSITVLNSSKDPIESCNVLITSWDLMSRRIKELKEIGFGVIILDESHFMKNFKAARFKAATALISQASRVILLSGTPALSRPQELYNQIQAVDPNLFPNYHEYGIRYCDGKKGTFGWNFEGSSNMVELNIILEEKVMIRRLKEQVISQLPEKQREMIVLDPNTVRTQSSGMKDVAEKMSAPITDSAQKRGFLFQYFTETATAKVKAVRDYVSDLLESGKKFICFAYHMVMLDSIEELLEEKNYGYIRIDGCTPAAKRQEFQDNFQYQDDVRIAILSITAASTGLTLTAANLVVFAELYWNPGVLTQAEDRAHRIGQRDCVLVKYLVATETADDFIWPMVQKKLNVLSKAGLSKDNFSTADTKQLSKKTTQKTITDFFDVDEALFDELTSEDFENNSKRLKTQ